MGVLGLLLALLLSGCQPPPPATLRIGTNVWQGYEPLYLARDKGYYGDSRIRLVEYTSATQLLQAFRNGAIDAATLTLDESLQLAQDGQDFGIALILDFSHGADALVARPDIGSLAGLRGKRVGIENTALGAYMVTRALQQAGLSTRDIIPVTVRVDEHERAYREGRVDALVTFEPARSRLRAMGARELFNSGDIPNEVMDVLVLRRSAGKRDADQVRALLHGWFHALDLIRQDARGTARQMAPRLGIGPEEVTATFRELRLADRENNRAMLTGDPPRLLEIAGNLQQIMLRNKLLRGSVDIAALIEPGPLRELGR
jgi:NitT/TauT family transport system substrate-binding protein